MIQEFYFYFNRNSKSKNIYMYPSFHCTTIYNSQDMEAT